MEEGEENLEYGDESSPSNGDFILFIDVGRGLRMITLY